VRRRHSSAVEQLFRKSLALCAVLPRAGGTYKRVHLSAVRLKGMPAEIVAAGRLRRNRPWTPEFLSRMGDSSRVKSVPNRAQDVIERELILHRRPWTNCACEADLQSTTRIAVLSRSMTKELADQRSTTLRLVKPRHVSIAADFEARVRHDADHATTGRGGTVSIVPAPALERPFEG